MGPLSSWELRSPVWRSSSPTAEESAGERLLSHGLAAFNISALTATSVLTMYWGGGLAGFLGGIGTLEGGALFAWLWLTTWLCTRRALRGLRLLGRDTPLPVGAFLSRGFIWGGINGVLFLLGAVAFLGLLAGEPIQALAFLAAVVLSIVPVPGAFLEGGCIGLACCFVDLVLLQLCRLALSPLRESRCQHATTA